MGGGLAGGIVGGAMALGGSALSARWARREAKRNRKFQKFMYKRRYRMTVTDLKKAGINPILAAQGGLGGGSSPSGSMASMPDAGSAVSKGVATGVQVMLAKAQLENIRENTRKTSAEADVIGPRAELQSRLLERLGPLLDWAEQYLPEPPTTARKTKEERSSRKARPGRTVEISAGSVSKRPRSKIENLNRRERRYRQKRSFRK